MKPPYSRTVFDLICEQAEIDPSRIVAIDAGASLTYRQLVERSSRVAMRLRKNGVRRGDRVGLLSDNRAEWLEIFFAAAALGAIVVPFSTWSTASELEFLLNDSEVRWLFTIDRFGEQVFTDAIAGLRNEGKLPNLRQVVSIDGPACASLATDGLEPYSRFRQYDPLPDLPPGDGASAGDPLVILYTSGSSNRPKAVPLDHFAAIENGFNIGERQGLMPGDRVLISIPLFWSYGAVNALPAIITHGATLVLQGHFRAAGALDLIEQHKCTGIYTLPAMTNALVAHPEFTPDRTSTLRTGVTIGASQDIIKAALELGASEICNIYGGTENYGNCCVTPHTWSLDERAHCQGPPLPGVQIRIRDPETGEEAEAGTIGQIEVTGYLTAGYSGTSSQFNDETFTADGYFKTGDLGSLDVDGRLSFAGRSSEMIKRSGINVSPAEVEETLQRHGDVALAGVTGFDDPGRGEIIVAFVTARPGAEIVIAEILAHCREHLSRYKVPDHLIVSDALPLTVTGKLMRRELKLMATAELTS